MGFTNELKKRALELSQKAMERLLSDEKRAMKIASAIGSVQKGKQALDKGQDQLMHALSFATRSDYKAVGKQLSALKRRARELDEKLAELVRG
ncbi:MAG TPA: hypothetical protein VND93_13145 [Myxococcales bacterium]|nr:hypothetical protein [Myxococcales bacterium]